MGNIRRIKREYLVEYGLSTFASRELSINLFERASRGKHTAEIGR